MIRIDAALDETGLLKSCCVTGHAMAGPKGSDVVCAAVSVLTRTAFRTLADREGITLKGGALERGVFRMETAASAEARPFLAGAGAFLIEGLRSVAKQYPEYCNMHIYTDERPTDARLTDSGPN
ncbi:hypothetical protein FACS1894124_3720 [Spirochaetia bacterium]|nr:hypothetical protein FACS1894124_3720 [Spirochaetia bacterium]